MSKRLGPVALLLGALLAGACGGGGGVTPIGFPVTVERADGEQITFERPAREIVSLSPGHTEILFAIGAGDQVVAVDGESRYPPEVAGKTVLTAAPPDADEIAQLAPDLVVIMSGPEDLVRSLDQNGLPVLWLEVPDSLSAVFDQIDVLGQITDHIDGSDALVDSMDSQIQAIFNKVGPAPGPRVFHELDNDLTTISSSTYIGELYLVLNATSIADQPAEPFPQLTLEEIVQADPEVIILAHADASPESVKARPGWQGISAVKNDRVYALDPDILTRPGPRLIEGLEALAKLLQPDLFP